MDAYLEPTIGGFLKNSFIDYPGKIAAVIFLQGCNFRCPYCHNPDLVLPKLFKDPISKSVVFSFLEKRKASLDAVVVSGGEALIHRDLIPFLKEIKSFAYSLKLDTNGSFPERLLDVLDLGLVDFVSLDIKACEAAHSRFTGSEVPLTKVLESLDLLELKGVAYEVRITCLPGFEDDQKLLSLAPILKKVPHVVLQGFNPVNCLDEQFCSLGKVVESDLESLKRSFEKHCVKVTIR